MRRPTGDQLFTAFLVAMVVGGVVAGVLVAGPVDAARNAGLTFLILFAVAGGFVFVGFVGLALLLGGPPWLLGKLVQTLRRRFRGGGS
jgi:hypothetical protein